MINKDKTAEIMLSMLTKGREATMEAYGLSEETLNRYVRESKKHFGDTAALADIVSNYTTEEVKAIASGAFAAKERMVKSFDFSGEIFRALVMSDTHLGSSYADREAVIEAMAEGKRRECHAMLHAGDVTEGMSGRPGAMYELSHLGYKKQRDEAVEVFKHWEGRPAYVIAGNHDNFYNSKSGAGTDIVEDICDRIGASYLGLGEGDVNIKGITVKLFHGEDGASYAVSYRVQKIIESFTGGEKPNVLILGHDHKRIFLPSERNIHAIGAGCMQDQTPWMRQKKLSAHKGFWIVEMCIGDNEVKWIQPRWYPLYR